MRLASVPRLRGLPFGRRDRGRLRAHPIHVTAAPARPLRPLGAPLRPVLPGAGSQRGSSVSTQLLFPCPPWTSPRPHAEVRSWSPLSVSPLSKSFLSLTLSSCLGGCSFSALFPESSWWRMPKLFTPQLWWSPRSRVFRRLFPS